MAITTVKKSKLGYEDILFDVMGTGATTETLKSGGTYRTVQKVNASHLPITSTARAKKFASGATVSTTDVDGTLIQILDDLEDLGQPDDSTIEVSSGALRIKDLGVSAAKLAANAVETAKIKDANVTNAKLAATEAVQGSGSGATGTNVIKAKSIGAADLADGIVTGGAAGSGVKIAAVTITNDNIANTTIKAAKLVDTPSHYVVTAVNVALSIVTATGTATITGMTDTDVVVVSTVAAGAAYEQRSAAHSGTTLTVTYSGSIVSATVAVVVYRAVTA